jgi:Fe-S cluster biogenesis protein NfuA
VANDGDFQEQVRQLGQLVARFDQLPDSGTKAVGKELVQLLMDVHGAGLERMMEIVSESGTAAPVTIEKLGQDAITGNLLLLYSLHPDTLETRVQKAIERLRPRLRKLACAIELLGVGEGDVRVRLAVSSHSCGSSAKDLRVIVEDGMYEFAPDLASLEILGLEDPASAGFVPLESLLGRPLMGFAANVGLGESEGGD